MRKELDTVTLQCKLTDEELQGYGMEMAALLSKIDLLKEELSKFRAEVKKNVDIITNRVEYLKSVMGTKSEFRDVECVVRYNFDSGEKIWIRLDTNQIAQKAMIPDEELQESLAFKE